MSVVKRITDELNYLIVGVSMLAKVRQQKAERMIVRHLIQNQNFLKAYETGRDEIEKNLSTDFKMWKRLSEALDISDREVEDLIEQFESDKNERVYGRANSKPNTK